MTERLYPAVEQDGVEPNSSVAGSKGSAVDIAARVALLHGHGGDQDRPLTAPLLAR